MTPDSAAQVQQASLATISDAPRHVWLPLDESPRLVGLGRWKRLAAAAAGVVAVAGFCAGVAIASSGVGGAGASSTRGRQAVAATRGLRNHWRAAPGRDQDQGQGRSPESATSLGTVLARGADLLEAPSEQAAFLEHLPAGTVVIPLVQHETWALVAVEASSITPAQVGWLSVSEPAAPMASLPTELGSATTWNEFKRNAATFRRKVVGLTGRPAVNDAKDTTAAAYLPRITQIITPSVVTVSDALDFTISRL